MQSSINNIYQLDGRVPVAKAIPFGLQHILAMFVSNLTPITLIAASAQPALTQAQIAILLQNAMFVAGIATLIQLYPIWKIGSRLPVVMGVSFTFVTVLSTVAANYGYPAVIGAVMIGGIMEGTLGLLAKYWRKIITPVVAASVVTSIGFSLFTVGARSFGGGYNEDFGSAQNLLLGTITLAVCLLWNVLSKGYLKQLSVLAGLVVGYIIAIFMGKVDLGSILSGGFIYHYDRSCMYDPGRTAATHRKLFRFTSGFCCGRMYHYDVRFHSDIWCTDDRFLRFFPAEHYHCFSFPGRGNWIYHSK